jgi:hypothetical protein
MKKPTHGCEGCTLAVRRRQQWKRFEKFEKFEAWS